jgi:hypothetical protein
MALAAVLHAQTAINSEAISNFSGSTLPLHNLLIEVRQISQNDAGGSSLSVQGIQGTIQGNTRYRSQSANNRQQVLVRNGRPAAIALRNSVPLRLVQTAVHNGDMIIVPGVADMARE